MRKSDLLKEIDRLSHVAIDEQYSAAIARAARDSYWRLAETLHKELSGLLDNVEITGEQYKRAMSARLLFENMKRNRGSD